MPFDLIHFRGADKILKEKKMKKDVQSTLEYLDNVLYEAPNPSKLMREALEEMGWRENGALTILDGRGYRFKGFKNGIALEGSFSAYEFILEGLFRLQVAFDKKTMEMGILLLNSFRSEKTKFGSTRELCEWEVESLVPTISMPVSIALYDLGAVRYNTRREDLSELREKYKMDNKPEDEDKQESASSQAA